MIKPRRNRIAASQYTLKLMAIPTDEKDRMTRNAKIAIIAFMFIAFTPLYLVYKIEEERTNSYFDNFSSIKKEDLV